MAAIQKLAEQLSPGTRVRVTQTLRHQGGEHRAAVEGEVVSIRRDPTGSWFANSRRDKVWLDRVTIRKPDGELSDLVVDEQTQIEVL
ncbi:MAG: hypothetical protein BIFFINMI_00233 [Phycisphaerae bacterium]|nr:hypothetical protein [Phycisphaerae bacterium]